jgi:dUTP pyrophosphatase
MFYLKVKKINPLGKLNEPAKEGDCGHDVYSMEYFELLPHERKKVPLGIALEFPDGYYCEVKQKSGLAVKYGIDTIGNIIDSGYCGEINATIVNTSNEKIIIMKNEKIAQLIFQPYVKAKIEYVETLSETDRGENGFGSTK